MNIEEMQNAIFNQSKADVNLRKSFQKDEFNEDASMT